MRIAFDVSPLSHERTGVNNYILGSLRGLCAAAQNSGDEVVAFAPTSAAGKRTITSVLDGLPLELRLKTFPGAHGFRTAWSRLGHPKAERWLGSFDVLHFTDWMYPPQSGGIRATTIHDLVPLHFPEWVTGRTQAMHTRKYRHAASTCDVMFANSAFTADDVAKTLEFPRERVVVAHPGIGEAFTYEGDPAELGYPYALTVATLEPRKNLGTLVDTWAQLGDTGLHLVVVGGEGWGAQPKLDRPSISRLGRVTDEKLASLYRGADLVVYPSRFEGFGMPITEAMACGTPVVASSHPSLDEACGDAAIRADPESADAFAGAVREALARHDELRWKGFTHAGQFSWAKTGETFLEGYRQILVAIDTTPLLQTRAGTARYLRGLLTHLDVPVERLSYSATSRARTAAADLHWYPRLRAKNADVLHCPTFRGPFSSPIPLVVTVHDLGVLRHPEWFNRWTRSYSRFAVPRVVRAASRLIAVSEFTRGELVELLDVDPQRVTVIPNGVDEIFTAEGDRADGDYVLAVGTLEPRKNLGRIAAAVDGELRVVGAPGWGGVEAPANVTWLREADDEELARQYRGARCLVYASLYEGFGLPVAEALACGCPVVTTAGSAMAEVAGDDATYVDAADVESIRDGIGRAFRPEPRLVASWADVARATERVYEDIA